MRPMKFTRRSFLAGAGAAAAGLALWPRRSAGAATFASPNERLNIAGIGVGGQGRPDLEDMATENIVALCDVDHDRASGSFERWPDARQFTDFRVMLDDMGDEIDAVVIATPDHTHAVAAMACMQMGKHVYVEKPLTWSVKEARVLRDAAREYGVATQMGNQGMANNDTRRLCEMIWTGAIGQIHEVHVWTDRPIWPQGIDRPEETPEIPDHLDWDLWLGPAPERPYSDAYVPFNWRGFWDFGTGALGDMACHNMNGANKALQLGAPASVEMVRQEGMTEEAGPNSCVIRYEFSARGNMAPVTMYWYEGGETPELPEDLPEDTELGEGGGTQGTLFIGEDGYITCGTHSTHPRLLPESLMDDYETPPELLPRSPGHRQEFVQACKGGPPAGSNFEYACPFTEMVLLGNVALRSGERIEWDSENLRVTNVEAANDLLHREYRNGWTL